MPCSPNSTANPEPSCAIVRVAPDRTAHTFQKVQFPVASMASGTTSPSVIAKLSRESCSEQQFLPGNDSFFLQFPWNMVEWLCRQGGAGTNLAVGKRARASSAKRPLVRKMSKYGARASRCPARSGNATTGNICWRRAAVAPHLPKSPGACGSNCSHRAACGNRFAPLWRLPVYSPRVALLAVNNKNTPPVNARSTRTKGGICTGTGAHMATFDGAYLPSAYPCPGRGAMSDVSDWPGENSMMACGCCRTPFLFAARTAFPDVRACQEATLPRKSTPCARTSVFPFRSFSSPGMLRKGKGEGPWHPWQPQAGSEQPC